MSSQSNKPREENTPRGTVPQFPEPEKVTRPTDPEESDLRRFIRHYVWLPNPQSTDEPPMSRWQAFKRYFLRIPAPGTPPPAATPPPPMATAEAATHPEAEPVYHHGTATVVGHPPYMQVFVWLIVLTAIEVFPIFTEIFFDWTPIPHDIWVPILLLLAFIKATLVAMYYMHLKYDQSWLMWVLLGPFAFALLFGAVIVAS
jgi:caa(3)-type oxidase subunit IV